MRSSSRSTLTLWSSPRARRRSGAGCLHASLGRQTNTHAQCNLTGSAESRCSCSRIRRGQAPVAMAVVPAAPDSRFEGVHRRGFQADGWPDLDGTVRPLPTFNWRFSAPRRSSRLFPTPTASRHRSRQRWARDLSPPRRRLQRPTLRVDGDGAGGFAPPMPFAVGGLPSTWRSAISTTTAIRIWSRRTC
jgi:hypothetical protein